MGWFLLYIFGILYLFCGIAIVCDDFFTASLEQLSIKFELSEDVAGAIIFLASDLGNFITGEDIYVDGGETLHLGHDARDMINPEMFEKRERGDGKNE